MQACVYKAGGYTALAEGFVGSVADLVAAAGTCRLWKAAAEGLRPEEAAWAALALEEYDI